jgi:hypothetical protein
VDGEAADDPGERVRNPNVDVLAAIAAVAVRGEPAERDSVAERHLPAFEARLEFGEDRPWGH